MKFRQRNKRKVFVWQVILAITLSFALFLTILFLGLPFLAKFSLIFEKIKGRQPLTLVDKTPPFPPQLETSYTATNSARVLVKGTSEPGSLVKLYLNNEILDKILIGKDGALIKIVTLEEGKNEIKARAVDEAGNESSFSNPLLIYYKKTAPFLEIDYPTKEDFQTEEKEVEIKGRTDPEVNLTINDRFVLVKSDGSFNYSLSLSQGENLILIIATDQAGNQTKKEIKVKFSAKTESD